MRKYCEYEKYFEKRSVKLLRTPNSMLLKCRADGDRRLTEERKRRDYEERE